MKGIGNILSMNEIMIKLTPEQFATMNKLLEPYVQLYSQLNAQFRMQTQVQKPATENKEERGEE